MGVGRALHQFVVRLCHRGWRKKQHQPEGPYQALHDRPPLEHVRFATAIVARDVSLLYFLYLHPVPARAWGTARYGRDPHTTPVMRWEVKECSTIAAHF